MTLSAGTGRSWEKPPSRSLTTSNFEAPAIPASLGKAETLSPFDVRHEQRRQAEGGPTVTQVTLRSDRLSIVIRL